MIPEIVAIMLRPMDMLVTLLAQQAPPDGAAAILQYFPLILIVGIFYFLLIRPQQKKESDRQELLKKLQKNDKVVTTGGIYGVVTSVKDDEVTLKVDEHQNVKIRFTRSAIAGIVGEGGEIPPVGEDRPPAK
jgi:preprotein translocase subunit YajC